MSFLKLFEGSDMFYLADPTKLTFKKNGGSRWGVKKEFNIPLGEAIKGHLDGSLKKGVVLPPIRKSDNKCKWAAIDIDGNIYKDDDFKRNLLDKITELELPLITCFSKSRGFHLFVFFNEWTDAQTVIDILHTFLHKLELPSDTECFPKQAVVADTGNGIMLPYMHGIGNDLVRSWDGKKFITGSRNEFELYFSHSKINAEDIKIELPAKANGKAESAADDVSDGPNKFQILKGIKEGTIKAHKSKDGKKGMGGKYHSWIQVVIAKCVKEGYGDNEILKLIKEVHEDKRGMGYVWPESYQKQIDYTRRESRFNKPNPGDTNILEGTGGIEAGAAFENIMQSYCYVMANDMFNQIGSGEFYQAMQINNYHKHEVFIKNGTLTNKLLKNKNFKRAQSFMTNAKFAPGLVDIDKPGIVPLINKGIVLNIYVPNYITAKEGDVQFLIDFFIWLIGEKKWRIIEQWIAYMLQYPGEKIKWSVVLVSVIEGVGKGLLARIGSRILGHDNVNENANYKHLTNTHNTLLVGTQLLVLNEVSLGDFKSKTEGTNTLKNFVADDIYSCNFKNKPMVKLPNLTNIMLFSNDEQVLGLKQGSRRYFFCNITKSEQEIIDKTDEGFFKEAWDFVDSDEGAAALIHYFKHEVNITAKDLTKFKARAPQTEDLKELIEKSKHPVQKKLEWDLVRPDYINRKIFTGRWCGLITFDELNERLNTSKTDDITKERFDWGSFGDDALYKFLSANCTRWNNGDATRQISIDGVKHRFYLLDDARCPIPGKSYKDLAPKKIETIYNDYLSVVREIETEETNYISAKDNIDEYIKGYKDKIGVWLELKTKSQKLFRNKPVEQIYEEIMDGTIPLTDVNDNHDRERILNCKKILKRGIRTPEQILEERINPKQKENLDPEDYGPDDKGLTPNKPKVSLNL